MAFNISGKVKVTNIKEVSPNLITGTLYTSEKKYNSEEWETTFIKAKFVGGALQEFCKMGIKDKDTFNVDNAKITVNKYKNKDGIEHEELVITVFELSKFVEHENNYPKELQVDKKTANSYYAKNKNYR